MEFAYTIFLDLVIELLYSEIFSEFCFGKSFHGEFICRIAYKGIVQKIRPKILQKNPPKNFERISGELSESLI